MAINHVHASVPDLSLRQRNPSACDWIIADKILASLKPVFSACCSMQSSEGYLLSDTLLAVRRLCERMHGFANIESRDSTDALHTELIVYCRRLASAVETHLMEHLKWRTVFNRNSSHYMIALMLDPRSARLNVLESFVTNNDNYNLRAVVANYTDVLIDWMVSYKQHICGESEVIGTEPGDTAFGLFSDAFSGNSAGLRDLLLEELRLYQSQTLSYK